MRSPIDDEIRQIFDQCSGIDGGEVATYIPELADAGRTAHGLCVMSVEGHSYAYGAVDVPFTIQSISKVFAYALALETHGFHAVDALIDVEPSGEAFNELSLDARTHRPRNPMINAGAITASSLLPGDGPAQQVDRIVLDPVQQVVVTLDPFQARVADQVEAAVGQTAGFLDGDAKPALHGAHVRILSFCSSGGPGQGDSPGAACL